MKWTVRAFARKPSEEGGSVELEDFDEETEGFIPQVGDFICCISSDATYKIIARRFEYSTGRCALEVEKVESSGLSIDIF